MILPLTPEQRTLITESQDFWFASVRPDPAGHLVPIWAVLVDDIIYMGTERKAQKVKNIVAHPCASLALPDTRNVFIVEGTVTLLDNPVPSAVLEAFITKYNWNIAIEPQTAVIALVPEKILAWNP